ncbi:SDR family NAD(P)-dependent oxidoreductase [Rhizobium leguminosarum]|uniref:SDR family NAD(P)-dependent oxidoreductase n=1 Tax=Rhizobium leguminosarum TaxID=384 RepID=UPI003F9C9161
MSKSLLIIGAGPGMSDATAERFGKEGWQIILGARTKSRVDQQVAGLVAKGIKANAIEIDASRPGSVRAAFSHAEELTGGLTAVLYNASIVRQQDLFSMTDADIQSDLAINVGGAISTVRSAVETFGSRGGTILITGGGFAVYPNADWMSLSIGKAGVRALAQALAPELAKKNIRVGMMTVATLVSPGSKEATDVAEGFWALANSADGSWETVYPAS